MREKAIRNICCIGAGFVGGPTMAVIAYKCPELLVNVVDINKKRIQDWNNKDLTKLPIYEDGLSEIIKNCRDKNLFFSHQVEKHIKTADMIFISVNTPTKTKGVGAGKASDLKWIEASARLISKYARTGTIVVEKSTVPVKTAETINTILRSSEEHSYKNKALKKFTVLSSPEFLSEGTAVNDLLNPDRVLIGGEDENAIQALVSIYMNWIDQEKIFTTDLWSSELSKLIANALLAQRISSINSFSALCENTDANIKDVSQAIGLDKRLGKYFLNAGPGFGGSCFKKDILNLIYICNHYGLKEVSEYWAQVLEINDWQQRRIVTTIVQKLFGTIHGKKLAILGFAFKANTNDTRESPAINICKRLIDEGSCLSIFDPKVSANKIQEELGINQSNSDDFNKNAGVWESANSINDAANQADAIIILTEWAEFKNIDWSSLKRLMRSPSWLFDTRSLNNVNKVREEGFKVWSIGYGK